MAKSKANTIQRSVYFFRVEATDHNGKPKSFDAKGIFSHLKTLPFTDAGLYRDNGDGSTNAIWVDKSTPLSIRYGVVRRDGLPTVERSGALSPLPIAPDDGLCEPIHVVFFENNIVGAEFNFYGPRLTGLAYYLKDKGPTSLMPEHLRFGMLLKQDPVGLLNRLDALKVLDLKIKASDLDELRALGGVNPFSSFEAADAFGQPDTIEVVMKAGRKKESSLSAAVPSFIRKMISKKKLALAESFMISGTDTETGRMVTFDLLNEHWIARKQMLRLDGRSRAVQTESAYLTIREAHRELKDQLERAPSA